MLAACIFACSSYIVLIFWHTQDWYILLATALLGVGIAMGFAAMSNLVVEAVPPSQTGVATGMNTNIRNIGAAVGAGVATSVVVSSLLANGVPKEHGYILAFIISAVALVIAALATLAIPRHAATDYSAALLTPTVAVAD